MMERQRPKLVSQLDIHELAEELLIFGRSQGINLNATDLLAQRDYRGLQDEVFFLRNQGYSPLVRSLGERVERLGKSNQR